MRTCDLFTGLWLAESNYVNRILASDWLSVITWSGYWPLIGQELGESWTLGSKVPESADRQLRDHQDDGGGNHHQVKLNISSDSKKRVWWSVLSIRPVCKSLFNRQWMVCGQWERKILRSQLSSEERTTVSKIFSRLGLWLETVGDWWLHHILETIIRWSPLQHCACFRFFIRITKELN